MSKTNIRALIVDAQALLRPALIQGQTCQPVITPVGMAHNYAEAERLAAQLSPDIIWLNLSIGDGDGVAEIRRLKELAPASHILAITGKENEQEAFAAIMAGAQGYLSQETIDAEEIESLFQMLLQDECVIRPALLVPLMQRLRSTALSQTGRQWSKPMQSKSREPGQLKAHEGNIVRSIRQGYRDSAIGKMLFLPERAMRKLAQGILNKFGL